MLSGTTMSLSIISLGTEECLPSSLVQADISSCALIKTEAGIRL